MEVVQKKTILLVEDDKVVREMLKEALERDYNVYEASGYKEALKHPIKNIDLALIDYMLPEGRNGLEVLKAIRQEKPSIPAIIMTGFGTEVLAIKAFRTGATDYIKKPLRIAYLRKILTEILEGRNGSGQHEEETTPASREEFIINSITEYIEHNYKEELTLEELAHRANMDLFKFSRAFKNQTGQSLPSYLNTVRISRASELMTNPEFNITDIALNVGYGNLGHFWRVFKTINGMLPGEYRKKITEKKG
jgi:YesN/AraC family two-component response regulator